MILFTTRMIKVMISLIVVGISWYLFRWKLSKKVLLRIEIITILISFLLNWLTGFLPPLTDRVTLTALGEGQSDAESSEVFLSGYRIDGKTFSSGKSLEIVEGHWFWSGETLAWRPETDPRQPDNVIRTVVLNIPVGWLRTLRFSGGPSRGCVEIDTNDNKWVVDTYREENSTVSIGIGRSETLTLIINQIRYLLLYAVLLFVFSAMTDIIIYSVLQSPESAKKWIKCNSGKLIYFGISIVTFCLMFYHANRFSLWLDEMIQIAHVKGSLLEAVRFCLNLNLASPPLALLCSTIWYHIAPYGEQWLLMVSILLSVLSIYIVALIGEKVGDIHCGILAAIMMAFSITVWVNSAYEFRDYPYLLMFSTLSLYLYICKNKYNRHLGWAIAFSLSLTSLAMVHYFGMLACAAYFLGDLFLWYKKQVKWKEVFLFLFPGICSLVWLLSVINYQNSSSFINSIQWYVVPSILDVRTLLKFLAGETEFSYIILLYSFANCIAFFLQDIQDKRNDFKWTVFYQRFLACEIIIIIGFMYIYGNYINPNSTLWTERYFMFLIPVTIILSAMSLRDLLSFLGNRGKVARKAMILFIGLILSINCMEFISSSTSNSLQTSEQSSQPYREAADWLYKQDNIFNDTTLIITTHSNMDNHSDIGWMEYYITRQGRRDMLNVIHQNYLSQEEVFGYNNIYLFGRPMHWLQELLDEKYIMIVDNYSRTGIRGYVKKNE